MTIRRNRPTELTDAPERRAVPIENIELRNEDAEDPNVLTLTGYASTFQEYEMYGGPEKGGWIERIDPGAFEKTLREKPDLHLLINHAGMPLARTKSGTLGLEVDHIGLKVTARLDKRDPEVQSLAIKMDRKDMDEMSFAFRVKDQDWDKHPSFEDLDDPYSLRTITELSLHKGDVSVVNWGANPTTSASVRGLDMIRFIVDADDDDLAEVRSLDGDLVKRALDKLTELAKPEADEEERNRDSIKAEDEKVEEREVTAETVLADIEAAGLMEQILEVFRSVILGNETPEITAEATEDADERSDDDNCGDCDKESDDCVCSRSDDGTAEISDDEGAMSIEFAEGLISQRKRRR